MKKLYYGFRFFSNESCTMGDTNPRTGRMSIAGEMKVFKTITEQHSWVMKEKLTAPTGLGGGKRIAVSKKELRNLLGGLSLLDFEEKIEMTLDWENP